jgi:hypothetical protein
MAASIALGCGGKTLVCGARPWRGRRQARFVNPFIFLSLAILLFSETEACLWHKADTVYVTRNDRSLANNGHGDRTAVTKEPLAHRVCLGSRRALADVDCSVGQRLQFKSNRLRLLATRRFLAAQCGSQSNSSQGMLGEASAMSIIPLHLKDASSSLTPGAAKWWE